MKVIQMMTDDVLHLYVEQPGSTVTLCGWKSYRKERDVTEGEVTCPDCLKAIELAKVVVAMLPQTVSVLNFHTDYGNDDACDTLLAAFADPADAERHRAALTANLQPFERSTLSYNTDTVTVIAKGGDFTGGPYG